jgi:hypothetical protein
MVCLIDPLESGPTSLMNAASGIMVICWLLSLPLSAPTGCDSASAAVWSFPSMCWSMKLQSCNSPCHCTVRQSSF